MTLTQLIAADISVQRSHALVFGDQLRQALAEKWSQYGSTNCMTSPVLLVDGRYIMSADVLSEVGEGGLLQNMWENSDLQTIEAGVTILLWPEVQELLPPPLEE